MAWELWRQDDNGSRFLVGRYEDESDAKEKMSDLSLVLHKQTYWISAVKQCPDSSQDPSHDLHGKARDGKNLH